MFCKHCGTRNEEGSRFCESCGARMINPRQKQPERKPEASRQGRPTGDSREFRKNESVNNTELSRQRRATDNGQRRADYPVAKSQGEKTNKRKKLLLIGTGVLLLAAILLTGWIFMRFQNTRAFNDAIEEGNRYLLAENLEQAEAHFLRAIEINPREVEPYLQLADIYMSWGEPERAIEILEQGREAVSEECRPALVEVLDEIRESEGVRPPTNEEDEGDEPSEPRFRWVLEPFIEADDINYVRFENFEYSINQSWRIFPYRYGVIRRGERLGLIDNNGNVIGGMYYDIASFMSWFGSTAPMYHGYLLHLIEYEEMEDFGMVREHTFINNEFAPIGNWGGPSRPSVIFYYSQGLRYIVVGRDVDPASINAPSVPVGVTHMTEVFMLEGPGTIGEAMLWYWDNAVQYGIYAHGEMRTDFIFTRTGSWVDGLIAVEKDGRWGYLNDTGEIVIPIEFDPSWHYVVTHWDGEQERWVKTEYPMAFNASEGFVPLVKNGVWEMRDTGGEVVIPPGVFDAIRPVVDGRSWVLQDGLWGIIEMLPTDVTNQAETPELELSIEELGRRIEAAGTFWEDWWTLSGWFTRENFQWLDWDDEVPEVLVGNAGPWGWVSLESPLGSDIHNFLMQHYTESWVNAELTRPQIIRIIEYDGILYSMGARAGLVRPNWETATHVLIEQEGGRAVVETTVFFGAWHRTDFDPMDYATEEIFRFTFINGRIDSIDGISGVELW